MVSSLSIYPWMGIALKIISQNSSEVWEMNKLLRAETYKLKRNKTFWVLLITMIGLSSFLHYLIVSDWWFMSGTPFDQAGLSELNALSVFMTPLYFNFVVSTLAGYYISVEFSQTRVIK